jgi:hypothetical protein
MVAWWAKGSTNKTIPRSSIVTWRTNKIQNNVMAMWWQHDGILMTKHDEQTKRTLDTITKDEHTKRSSKFQDP